MIVAVVMAMLALLGAATSRPDEPWSELQSGGRMTPGTHDIVGLRPGGGGAVSVDRQR